MITSIYILTLVYCFSLQPWNSRVYLSLSVFGPYIFFNQSITLIKKSLPPKIIIKPQMLIVPRIIEQGYIWKLNDIIVHNYYCLFFLIWFEGFVYTGALDSRIKWMLASSSSLPKPQERNLRMAELTAVQTEENFERQNLDKTGQLPFFTNEDPKL